MDVLETTDPLTCILDPFIDSFLAHKNQKNPYFLKNVLLSMQRYPQKNSEPLGM